MFLTRIRFIKNANTKTDSDRVKSLLNDNASRAELGRTMITDICVRSELIEWSAWTYPSRYDGKAGSDK